MSADEELIRSLNGLYVGQLTPTELSALRRCVVRGTAMRDYSGPAGFMGLGKVRFIGEQASAESANATSNNPTPDATKEGAAE